MFRGKESSNRIEISQLVQDLLNFGVLGSLWLWGGGRWLGGVWGHGSVPTHMHTHVHACTHTHTHAYTDMYTCIEIANGHPIEASMFIMLTTCMCMCVCVCVCVCACAYVHQTPPTHPYPLPPQSTHLPPPRGTQNQ